MCCLQCNNCKDNQPTYYCIEKNEILTNENYEPSLKERNGWKKGNKDYETRRRILRKGEIEL